MVDYYASGVETFIDNWYLHVWLLLSVLSFFIYAFVSNFDTSLKEDHIVNWLLCLVIPAFWPIAFAVIAFLAPVVTIFVAISISIGFLITNIAKGIKKILVRR